MTLEQPKKLTNATIAEFIKTIDPRIIRISADALLRENFLFDSMLAKARARYDALPWQHRTLIRVCRFFARFPYRVIHKDRL